MREIKFNIPTQFNSYKNKFEDMFFNNKFYSIIDERNNFIFVDFYNKEKLNSIKHVENINKSFTKFCRRMAEEVRNDKYNDLFLSIYQDKIENIGAYDKIDLRTINTVRFIIDSNTENEILYFPNSEMVCNSDYLEDAIGKFQLLEFNSYEEMKKFSLY